MISEYDDKIEEFTKNEGDWSKRCSELEAEVQYWEQWHMSLPAGQHTQAVEQPSTSPAPPGLEHVVGNQITEAPRQQAPPQQQPTQSRISSTVGAVIEKMHLGCVLAHEFRGSYCG